MEMIIDFSGSAKVDAHFGHDTIPADQPPMDGGKGSAQPHGDLRGDPYSRPLPPARHSDQ